MYIFLQMCAGDLQYCKSASTYCETTFLICSVVSNFMWLLCVYLDLTTGHVSFCVSNPYLFLHLSLNEELMLPVLLFKPCWHTQRKKSLGSALLSLLVFILLSPLSLFHQTPPSHPVFVCSLLSLEGLPPNNLLLVLLIGGLLVMGAVWVSGLWELYQWWASSQLSESTQSAVEAQAGSVSVCVICRCSTCPNISV